MNSQRTITCWCMGLTQNKKAVSAIEEIVNLHLMRGQIGKPGAVMPVRGHSNVQGDRTVGIWERPRPDFPRLWLKNLTSSRHEHGYDVVESIKAMHVGKQGVHCTRRQLSFFSNSRYKLHSRSTTALPSYRSRLHQNEPQPSNRRRARLILPCLGRTEIDMQAAGEQFVSTENSGVVQSSRGCFRPHLPYLRSEPNCGRWHKATGK